MCSIFRNLPFGSEIIYSIFSIIRLFLNLNKYFRQSGLTAIESDKGFVYTRKFCHSEMVEKGILVALSKIGLLVSLPTPPPSLGRIGNEGKPSPPLLFNTLRSIAVRGVSFSAPGVRPPVSPLGGDRPG